jgi:ribosome maturation factor RimP
MLIPVVKGSGYELLGIDWASSEGHQALLRLYVEKVEGVPVTIDDCAIISREISTFLDVEGKLEDAYLLEVSSPGMDRILFTFADLKRFVGQEVKVALKFEVEGARRHYQGLLSEVNEQGGFTVIVDGVPYDLIFDKVDRARLVPDFSKVFKKTREAKNDE